MEVSIVSRKMLQSGPDSRFDADYVQASRLQLEARLLEIGSKKLKIFAKVNSAPTVSEDAFEADESCSYIDLDSVDIEDGFIFAKELRFGERPSRARHLVSRNQVLVGNVRPSRGITALTTKSHEGSIASSGFTVLEVREKSEVSAKFVWAFLRSRFGRSQLIRRSRGSMYPAVLPRDFSDILIPQPPRDFVASIEAQVEQVVSLWSKFGALKKSMESMMSALLADIEPLPGLLWTNRSGVDSAIIQRSDCFREKGPLRLDADFYRQEFQAFGRRMAERVETAPLGKYFKAIQGRVSGGDEDIPTVRQAMLTNAGVNWSAITFERGSIGGSRPRVLDGDVLLAAMAHEAHYLGRRADYVETVPKAYRNNHQVIHHLMILRRKTDDGDPYLSGSVLAAFLRHPYGMHQVQRCNRGVRGDHVGSTDLEGYVQMPIPPAEWQRKFDKASAAAEKARLEAKRLQGDAELKIEIWIESRLASSSTRS